MKQSSLYNRFLCLLFVHLKHFQLHVLYHSALTLSYCFKPFSCFQKSYQLLTFDHVNVYLTRVFISLQMLLKLLAFSMIPVSKFFAFRTA